MLVDPGLRALGQQRGVELARREHHLRVLPLDLVAIDVDVAKVVVEADFLELPIGRDQRARVPHPDVIDSRRVIGERCGREHARSR